MAENGENNDPPITDLNAVITEQQETIKTVTEQLENAQDNSFKETIFSTTPTAPPKPKNFVVFILIGVIIFLIFRGRT